MRTCPICSKEFKRKTDYQTYCSKRCAKIVNLAYSSSRARKCLPEGMQRAVLASEAPTVGFSFDTTDVTESQWGPLF